MRCMLSAIVFKNMERGEVRVYVWRQTETETERPDIYSDWCFMQENSMIYNTSLILWICTVCAEALDLGIVIDSSSSVREKNFDKVKTFLVNLVDDLKVSKAKTHVAAIHYNHYSYVDWDFNKVDYQNPNALKAAILKIPYQPGGTRTDKVRCIAHYKYNSLVCEAMLWNDLAGCNG